MQLLDPRQTSAVEAPLAGLAGGKTGAPVTLSPGVYQLRADTLVRVAFGGAAGRGALTVSPSAPADVLIAEPSTLHAEGVNAAGTLTVTPVVEV